MTPPRSELEREILSLRDQLEIALVSLACARNLLVGWVSEESRQSPEYKRLLALVSAVAKESPIGAPLLARMGWQQGMKEARELVREVGKSGAEEWTSGCRRAVEEIDRKIDLNL